MESVTNEDLGSRVGIIETRLNTLITTVDRYIVSAESRHNTLENKVNERGQFRWQIVFGAIAAIAVVIGGAFTILKQQTDLSVALALAPIIAQNQVSITDRGEIRAVIARNGDRIGEIESAQVKQTERATEVETQIHDLHTIGNLDRSYQMAFIGALWRNSFKQTLPFDSVQTQPRILPR